MWHSIAARMPRHHRLPTIVLIIPLLLSLIAASAFIAPYAVHADPDVATLTGTAFRDFNNNGTRDTREPGIAGIAVAAVDQTGATATATTAANGSYSLSGLTGFTRVEFTLPADNSLSFLQPAAAGGTVVQFIYVNSANTADVGFFNPSDYAGA